MALEIFGKKFMDSASKFYKKALGNELNKMGTSRGGARRGVSSQGSTDISAKIALPIISHTYFLRAGLQYEDLLNSSRPEVAEALDLADPDVMQGRLRRLKRASDLTYKGKELQDYAPDMKLTPFKTELWEDVQKIKAREEEYALLDLHKK